MSYVLKKMMGHAILSVDRPAAVDIIFHLANVESVKNKKVLYEFRSKD
jgi:hypothetical protein